MKLRLAAALFASLSLSACMTAGSSAPEAAIPQRARVQLLAINDFHGNLETPLSPTRYADGGVDRSERLGGAAQLAATLASLRRANSVTVAAGDLIGASPLASSLFLDEPTIRALSQMGLEIASVGNHEFDRGVDELRRMQHGGCAQFTRRQPCALDPFTGAQFTYLAGNVVDPFGETLLPATMTREIDGATIGFIGLTLEGTANLVAASATDGYEFLDEAETANDLAQQLRMDGADAVVLLIHEGADVDPRYNLSGCPGLSGAIVPIVEALDPAISVVISGHTHQSYVCDVIRPDGSPLLLTSAGRYGGFVTDIEMVIDHANDQVLAANGVNVPVLQSGTADPAIAALVARYAEAAGPVANRQVGAIHDSGEHGEDCLDSPAQELVADSYLVGGRATMGEDAVDLAFVNSGGVRTDLTGADDGVLSYGELVAMSPFGNGIVVLEMTGEELKALLEQQWCEIDGQVRTCPSLLIPSANMTYRVDRAAPVGQRISAIMLDGAPIDPARSYKVITPSFLAGGGDGFSVFAQAAARGTTMAGFDIDLLEGYVARGDLAVPVCGRVRSL
ncbi:MAG: bifunctional metallophosphatase/5'-nucleotidase [Erythrobacter sp.]|nr:bifunctional metallophosphatase/5'-nucleotidase [Erythrobacter sp.]